MNTTTLTLSSEAYASSRFDEVFDSFRSRMGDDFRFTITPNSYRDAHGTVSQASGLTVTTNDATLAAEIIAALESAVTVHVISATSLTSGHMLSMCGKDLGPYETARAEGHVTGNYATPAVIRERVTCSECVRRTTD